MNIEFPSDNQMSLFGLTKVIYATRRRQNEPGPVGEISERQTGALWTMMNDFPHLKPGEKPLDGDSGCGKIVSEEHMTTFALQHRGHIL